MTTISLHPTPTYRTVAKEQIRAVGVALRKEGLLFVAFLAVIGILSVLVAVRHQIVVHTVHTPAGGCTSHGLNSNSDGPMSLLAIALIPMGAVAFVLPFGLAGFIVPFGVWRSDDLSRRAYHWTMPIARGPHTLIKMVSGWLWLMLALLLYLAFAVGLLTTLAHISDAACLMSLTWSWQWINPFSVTTLVYLFTSIAVIGSSHPWRWIGGLPIVYSIGISLFAGLGQHDVARVMISIVTGKYGLVQAMYGGLPNESTSRWLTALALWAVVGCIGVCIAAYQRSNTHVV